MRLHLVRAALTFVAVAAFGALAAYAHGGWRDASADAVRLRAEARSIIADGRGPESLGEERLSILLLVEDPNFNNHNGVDLNTPGAGATTITQSLSKRLAFKSFRKGLPKIRQTAFALSLEHHLSKQEILALALDRAPMGPGPKGKGRVTGFHRASEVFFGAAPSSIDEFDFLALVAVLIAPDALSLAKPSVKRDERVRRIRGLVSGKCAPLSHRDVWLDGCASGDRP